MPPDSLLLVRLARVRDLLLRPTPASLETCSEDLEWAIGQVPALRPAVSAGHTAIMTLVRQIRALHDQAGRLRFGAARLTTAEAAGYTSAGKLNTEPMSPHVAISG